MRRRSLLVFVTHYFSFNNEIIKAIGGKETVYLIIDAANDLAEKVTSQNDTFPELSTNDSAVDYERSNQLKELTNSIKEGISSYAQQNSSLDENQINESLANLKWQTHYLKILSEK